MSASVTFTFLQSSSLCLTTTSPERLAQAVQWGLRPLARVGVPVDELVLTLLLSLRFIGIVFDEVRNLAFGVAARGIQWKALQGLGTVDVLAALVGRLFENLFTHSKNIAEAMVARGYRGDPRKHGIFFMQELSMEPHDWMVLVGLVLVVGLSNGSTIRTVLSSLAA
eukprot:TRINITY_DN3703_c0_g2_i1.p1 TRINITY_DN3703_c0_g2~~TRINITY_DN3703_c0_g2_i1.p1  ORF type:complete len:180 (-),score=31.00 TRINITY_DN3703_c0_g2_i1:113-613(-)